MNGSFSAPGMNSAPFVGMKATLSTPQLLMAANNPSISP